MLATSIIKLHGLSNSQTHLFQQFLCKILLHMYKQTGIITHVNCN